MSIPSPVGQQSLEWDDWDEDDDDEKKAWWKSSQDGAPPTAGERIVEEGSKDDSDSDDDGQLRAEVARRAHGYKASRSLSAVAPQDSDFLRTVTCFHEDDDDATKRQKMEAQAAQRQVAHHSGAPLTMLRQPEPHAQTTALSAPQFGSCSACRLRPHGSAQRSCVAPHASRSGRGAIGRPAAALGVGACKVAGAIFDLTVP